MFFENSFSFEKYPCNKSILFAATMKGTLKPFRISIASKVWGCIPCIMSMTSTLMSAMLPPRFLRFVNASCPGVSMKSSPGISSWNPNFFIKSPETFSIISAGTSVAPMCCVIAPASFSAIAVPRMLSRNFVFPWSTWPSTVTIGCLTIMKNTFFYFLLSRRTEALVSPCSCAQLFACFLEFHYFYFLDEHLRYFPVLFYFKLLFSEVCKHYENFSAVS